MSKIIKIQSNLKTSPAYNADKIEAVFSGDLQQQVSYQTIDEYTLPFGTYLTLRNYDDILFDEATLQTVKDVQMPVEGDSSHLEIQHINQTYAILQSSEVPDCEMMYTLFNQYYTENGDCKGVVVISTSEEIYNEIVVTAEPIDNDDYRITNIYLDGEYSTLAEAMQTLEDESPVVFEFDEIYSKCAKYWKKRNDGTKTSGFDIEGDTSRPKDNTLVYIPSFDGGFGNYEFESGTGSGGGDEYNAENWKQFKNIGSISYVLPNGMHYLCDKGSGSGTSTNGTEDIKVKDYDCNIFDILFRYIYEYLYSTNELLGGDPYKVKDPMTYTFLLKTYKMYVKAPQHEIDTSKNSSQDEGSLDGSDNGSETGESSSTENSNSSADALLFSPTGDTEKRKRRPGYDTGYGLPDNWFEMFNIGGSSGNTSSGSGNTPVITAEDINSYSVKILSVDEIKELSADDAQEYFDNTLVHDTEAYKDKLILSESEAKEVLLSKGITSCGQYFLISSNVGIKSPSSQQYEYFDLGNFELIRESTSSVSGKTTRNEYKYNTNGKVVRVRQIYDPYTDEYYTISQNNSGEFSEGYVVDRVGVCVRSTSGKSDYYYYENNDAGAVQSEQLKEDILYAMEDGPSIVTTELLLDIDY